MIIKDLRLQQKLTSLDLAKKLNLTKAQMSYAENEKMLLNPETAKIASAVLKCSPKDLYPISLFKILADKNPTKAQKNTWFGKSYINLHFRTFKGGYNKLEHLKKLLGYRHLQDVYSKIIEIYIDKRIKLEEKKKKAKEM